MTCPKCGAGNTADALVCSLCGEVLRRVKSGAPSHFLEIEPGDQARAAIPVAAPPPAANRPIDVPSPAGIRPVDVPSPAFARGAATVRPDPPATGARRWLGHPAVAMGIGLLVFPLAKALWIPNYVFNFLTTLIHEIGHAACAWSMGRFSIPSVGIGGGGVTVWSDPSWFIGLLVWAGLGWLAWTIRARRGFLVPLILACVAYPLLAFTWANEFFCIAGGILFELAGASLCFYRALSPHHANPLDRPIYALWGWWMLLNRGSETVLMLRDPGYWESQAIYDSGLAAGLTNDLEVMREQLAVTSPGPILWGVLLLCILCIPAALVALWVRKRMIEES